MSTPRFQRVEEVLHAVLGRAPVERAAFLAQLCGHDATLQAEVHSLLLAHEHAGSFIAQPAIQSMAMAIESGNRVLDAGDRWGPFEVRVFLGAGGMGEVYRARDMRLGRDVAIKTLPRFVAADPERLARLEREARILAALSHPNIAAIHGLEEHDGARGLVLELVDGQTLADQLGRGPLSIAQTLKIARQIVEALDAAHEQGIVHRDLKPANVTVTRDGIAKVLDFGLATLAPRPAAVGEELAEGAVAAATFASTREGLQGTAPYMSPEQASGQPIDKRSDIWAFGCVLYEMLTGKRAFEGADIPDTLARILEREPDFAVLPAATPVMVRRLLRRCLEKDRSRRLADIADARFDLEEAASTPSEAALMFARAPAVQARNWGAGALLAGVPIALTLVWIGAALFATDRVSQVTRLLVDLSPAERLGGDAEGRPTRTEIALSPDGRSFAFSAVRQGQRTMYLRRFDQLHASPLAGTEGGSTPFFSPDGRWLGFWSNGELRKVSVDGGPAQMVASVPFLFGATWDMDNRIVLAFESGGLWQVSAAGGSLEPVTSLDVARGEVSHRLPHGLPDGDVLFTITRNRFPRWDETEIALYSRRNRTHHVLLKGGSDGRYVPSGHLVYVREGVLMAAPFARSRAAVTGESVALVADLMQSAYHPVSPGDSGAGQFSISDSGTLVYATGGMFPEPRRSVLMVDRSGREQPLPIPPRFFSGQARLSPDGGRVALFTSGRDQDIWIADVTRGTMTRLTTEGRNAVPVWTPDGERVVYRASMTGPDGLFWRRADGIGGAELLVRSERHQVPAGWSPDGEILAFYELSDDGSSARQADIWLLPRAGDRVPSPFAATPFAESGADFSPDGRWLAYSSDETGRREVYARPYPGPGPRLQISTDGGSQPVWGRDGRELFYTAEAGGADLAMMVLQVTLQPTLRVGAARQLFQGRYARAGPARSYDVTPDGRRFLFVENPDRSLPAVTHLVVVQNWVRELKQRVPVG